MKNKLAGMALAAGLSLAASRGTREYKNIKFENERTFCYRNSKGEGTDKSSKGYHFDYSHNTPKFDKPEREKDATYHSVPEKRYSAKMPTPPETVQEAEVKLSESYEFAGARRYMMSLELKEALDEARKEAAIESEGFGNRSGDYRMVSNILGVLSSVIVTVSLPSLENILSEGLDLHKMIWFMVGNAGILTSAILSHVSGKYRSAAEEFKKRTLSQREQIEKHLKEAKSYTDVDGNVQEVVAYDPEIIQETMHDAWYWGWF